MKYPITYLIIIVFVQFSWSQKNTQTITGKVTFITSENVYVRFDNTQQINIGDTLYMRNTLEDIAALKVEQKSSTSLVCKTFGSVNIKVQDEVIFTYTPQIAPEDPEKSIKEVKTTSTSSVTNTKAEKIDGVTIISSGTKSTPNKVGIISNEERIRGKITAASYSSFSAGGKDRHRMMTRFSFNADHINNSKLSFDTYINYSQNFVQGPTAPEYQTKFFRVYDLSAKYQFDESSQVVLGRAINRKVSSIGSIDGLQGEKHFGTFYSGIIVGFRPDLFQFDFNPNLFEYGAYIGFAPVGNKQNSETTLGLLEQRNGGPIDRRYLYFQHSSSIGSHLNLFGSIEADIYQKRNEITSMKPRVTNLYASANYRVNRNLSFSLSYDARKTIIYYETLNTEIEQLLDEDIARQGLRLRMNFRPFNNIFAGVSAGKRFQSNQQNMSDNYNAFLTHSKLPGIGGRLSVNVNWNKTSYLDSKIISLSHSRSLFNDKLDLNLYVRRVNYSYFNNETTSNQHYIGGDLSFRINREWSISTLGEISINQNQNNYRINTKLVRRFGKK